MWLESPVKTLVVAGAALVLGALIITSGLVILDLAVTP